MVKWYVKKYHPLLYYYYYYCYTKPKLHNIPFKTNENFNATGVGHIKYHYFHSLYYYYTYYYSYEIFN